MTEKFIAVVTTGGTIMCEKQPDSDKVTPKMTGLELLDNIEGLTDRFNIKLVEHSNMPGSDLSPNTAFKLKETIVSLFKASSCLQFVDNWAQPPPPGRSRRVAGPDWSR